MIVLLSGAKKNIGDFLITERARELFDYFLDDKIVILDRFKNLDGDIDLKIAFPKKYLKKRKAIREDLIDNLNALANIYNAVCKY